MFGSPEDNMRRVIVPCGSSKKQAPNGDPSEAFWKAEELYEGAYFTSCLTWAKSVAPDASIRILSAKHGFLPLDVKVAAYDMRFGRAGAVSVERLRAQVEADPALLEFLDPLKDVVILGGVDYVLMARQALGGRGRGLGQLMRSQMGGRPAGIGWQLSWFKRNRGIWPARDASGK